MVKSVKVETILDEWPLHKLYAFIKSFGLLLATAALNTNNTALKQAGYRGFELPQTETQIEIAEWFKMLKNKLNQKQPIDKSKPRSMVYII